MKYEIERKAPADASYTKVGEMAAQQGGFSPIRVINSQTILLMLRWE